MQYKSGCSLNYQIEQFSTLVFNIQVQENAEQQVLQETLKITPDLPVETYTDAATGNRMFRLNAPASQLQIFYQATIELQRPDPDPEAGEIPAAELPLSVLPYLYPSRYCQSDHLLRLAEAEFSNLASGYSRVQAIADWIYHNVAYRSGSTDPHTSALDTVIEREGVCRDFAHLGIALCRALTIPARFVSGYAYQLQPPDFHACFEAFLGDRWHLFDPTRLAPLSGFIRIGTGRDAADVSFANLFGTLQIGEMSLLVEAIDPKDS